MTRNAVSLKELVLRLHEANDTYADLSGEPIRQRLGKPADPMEVAAVEKHYGTPLPDDFREFLLMHNGWEQFDEELAILSTAQMVSGPLADWITTLKREFGPGDKSLEEGIVFVAAKGQVALTYFDRSKKRRDGAMDVVEWDDGEEVMRHRSFLAYLKETLTVVEELIEEER